MITELPFFFFPFFAREMVLTGDRLWTVEDGQTPSPTFYFYSFLIIGRTIYNVHL